MSKHQELFRIFVNSVQKARDPAEEHDTVMRLQRMMNTVLEPLAEGNRLRYFLEVDQHKLSQWLVVTCSDSLQQMLFDLQGSSSSSASAEDPIVDTSVMLAIDALKVLRHLSIQARLTPASLIEAIRTAAPGLIDLLTTREEPLTVQTRDGMTITMDGIRRLRRTMLSEPVSVRLRVDMLGSDKAKIELNKMHRALLKADGRYAMLHWHPMEHCHLYAFLRDALESQSLVDVDAYPCVNRHGQTVEFAYLRMSDRQAKV